MAYTATGRFGSLLSPRPSPAQPVYPMGYGTQGAAAPTQPAAPTGPYGNPEYNDMLAQHSDKPAGGVFGKAGFHQIRSEGTKLVDDQYKQMLDRWNGEKPVDYTSAAPIADQYGRNREQMQARLAALGQQGGTVAGAVGQSYDNQSKAVGDYLRMLEEARRKEHLDQVMSLEGFGRQIGLAELQRKWAKEDSPSFGQSLLHTVGSVGGALIGGAIGGPAGAAAGGGIGGGLTGSNAGYTTNDDPWGLNASRSASGYGVDPETGFLYSS